MLRIALGTLLVAGSALAIAADTAPPETSQSQRPAPQVSTAPAADAPAGASLAPQVRALVKQLDAPTLVARDAAEARLLGLGAAALELLPPDGPRLSAEQRQRLSRVRVALERQASENVAAASRLTLKAGRIAAADLVAQIAEQTGNEFTLGWTFAAEIADPKTAAPLEIAADVRDQPFWPALDGILQRNRLVATPLPGASQWRIDRVLGDAPIEQAVAFSGPFRFRATAMMARRDVASGQGLLTVRIETGWEPRLAPIALRLPLDSLRAETVGAESELVKTANAGALIESDVHRGVSAVELDLPLGLPSRKATELASLRGQVVALLLGKTETFEFTALDTARNVKKTQAAASVVLEEMFKNDDDWELRLRLQYEQAEGALESYRGWVSANEIYLVGPDGHQQKPRAVESSQGGNQARLTYRFIAGESLEKMKLVYKVPGAILNAPIDFELRNLPLP